MGEFILNAIKFTIIALALYGVLAFAVLPFFWRHYEHNLRLAPAPKTVVTAEGIRGDPLNVAIEGSEAEMVNALLAAGWFPADPVTVSSVVKTAKSLIFKLPYHTAPVSNLYLWGRKEDLAFEKPSGKSPWSRHHVRFWRSDQLGTDGGPLWLGAATFDTRVGVSRYTGQLTHHIAPDIDAERSALISDLENVRQLQKVYQVTGVGPVLNGTNGGGDRYFTDGEMTVGVLTPGNEPRPVPPQRLRNPAPVRFKERLWNLIRKLL